MFKVTFKCVIFLQSSGYDVIHYIIFIFENDVSVWIICPHYHVILLGLFSWLCWLQNVYIWLKLKMSKRKQIYCTWLVLPTSSSAKIYCLHMIVYVIFINFYFSSKEDVFFDTKYYNNINIFENNLSIPLFVYIFFIKI